MCFAVPAEVVSIGPRDSASIPGLVSFDGSVRDVDLIMVPDVAVGAHVVVHAGYAIRVVDDLEMRSLRELFD